MLVLACSLFYVSKLGSEKLAVGFNNPHGVPILTSKSNDEPPTPDGPSQRSDQLLTPFWLDFCAWLPRKARTTRESKVRALLSAVECRYMYSEGHLMMAARS